MNAVWLTGKQTLEYGKKGMPTIGDGEILLKVHAAGVCGSDLRIFTYGDHRVDVPRVIGHEVAGEIVEVGRMVEGFRAGDRVTIGAHLPCGTCVYCLQEQEHHCIRGESIGYQVDGGFAEYLVLPENFVTYGSIQKIADTTTYELASLSEPFSCVLSGLTELNVKDAGTVVIYGAGAIGCMFIAAARRMGAAKVIAVQRSKERQRMAKEAGADIVIDPAATDTVEYIRRLTGGLGADAVVVTAPSLQVQQEAMDIAGKMGKILYFAGTKPPFDVRLDTNPIIYKQLTIVGTHGAPRTLHAEAVRWIDEQLIDFSMFVTHTFPLADTEKAFQTALGKNCLKCVVQPWG